MVEKRVGLIDLLGCSTLAKFGIILILRQGAGRIQAVAHRYFSKCDLSKTQYFRSYRVQKYLCTGYRER
jgi:hypothetical protein